jgi:L-fuculose-phosphate aldolase
MKRTDTRKDLVRHFQWLRQYGLNDSHSGNASCRTPEGMTITPTGCCADSLCGDDLVDCPLDGPLPESASIDAALHAAVYRSRPDVNAMLHSHGPYSVAVTMGGGDFQPPDFEGRYYFAQVPVVDIEYDRYLEESTLALGRVLRECNVVIMRGHGVYACGETIDQAYKWSCSLESSARLEWLRKSDHHLEDSKE